MSLISNILKSLEEQFVSQMSEPDLQQVLLNEVSVLAQEIAKWLEEKLHLGNNDEKK